MNILTRKIAFLSIITITAVSCDTKVISKNPSGTLPPLEVKAVKVLEQSFENDVIATAELLASEQVELKAPLAGMVLGIYFKEGQRIREGESIIRLDDRVWKAQLLGLTSELENAQKDYERKKSLLEIEGSSQEEIDQAATTVATLKSQVQQLQINIQLANIKAPFSGTMGMRDFSLGAFLKEGDPITTLTATNTLKVNFDLPQEYITSVTLGKTVTVLLGKDSLKATIYAINPLINTGSRTINIRARLPQTAKKQVMPGTFAEVLVATNHIENALLIPTQAVVPEINNQTVYLYKGGKVVRKTIRLGARTADKVHVLEGIVAGDTLVTTGLLQIKDGGQVKLQTVK